METKLALIHARFLSEDVNLDCRNGIFLFFNFIVDIFLVSGSLKILKESSLDWSTWNGSVIVVC